MKYFKIYGLERTGTNYTSSLIEENFDYVKVFMNIGGWKHGHLIKYPNKKIMFKTVDFKSFKKYKNTGLINLFKKNKIEFLITVKNPYTWLNSYLEFYGKEKPYQKFVERNDENIVKIIKLWNNSYQNYKKFLERGDAHLIRYEDILSNYLYFLRKMMKNFNLKKKNDKFGNIHNKLRANPDGNMGKVKNQIFDKKNYYLQPEVNKIFKNREIKLINRHLDKDLVEFYGYRIEDNF